MIKRTSIAAIGIVCASLAMLISAVSTFLFGSPIAIFLCMVAVFCSNISIYAAEKKKAKVNPSQTSSTRTEP